MSADYIHLLAEGGRLSARGDAFAVNPANPLPARRRKLRRFARKGGRSCAECFFHRHLLCALDLDQPCSTFRPDGPAGLVPPRQPSLLMRRTRGETP